MKTWDWEMILVHVGMLFLVPAAIAMFLLFGCIVVDGFKVVNHIGSPRTVAEVENLALTAFFSTQAIFGVLAVIGFFVRNYITCKH